MMLNQSNKKDWGPKLQRFKDFCRTGRSYALICVFNCFFTFAYCPYYLLSEFHSQKICEERSISTFLFNVQVLFLLMIVCSSWTVYCLLYTTNETLLRLRHLLKSTFILSITLFFSLQFLKDILIRNLANAPGSNTYSSNSLILLIIVPFEVAEVFRETNDNVLIAQWVIISGSLSVMVQREFNANNLVILFAYCSMTILARLDRYLFNWTVFEDLIEGKRNEQNKEDENRALQQKIESYTTNALERKATEMRDMIGNVAHDLKTVSLFDLYCFFLIFLLLLHSR